MHGTETETTNSAQPNRQHFGLIVMIGTMSLFGPLAINMNLPGPDRA